MEYDRPRLEVPVISQSTGSRMVRKLSKPGITLTKEESFTARWVIADALTAYRVRSILVRAVSYFVHTEYDIFTCGHRCTAKLCSC